MKKLFVRSLLISAVVQFAMTRRRAGLAIEAGAAEAMWLRYPLDVVLNALIWTLLASMLGGAGRTMRRLP